MRKTNRQEWTVLCVIAALLLVLYVLAARPWRTHREPVANKTRAALVSGRYAILAYRQDYGQYPTSFQDLLPEGNERSVTYLEDITRLTDSWSQLVRYSPRPSGFEVRSAGPDKTFGTPDDIVQEETEATEQPLSPTVDNTKTPL